MALVTWVEEMAVFRSIPNEEETFQEEPLKQDILLLMGKMQYIILAEASLSFHVK